MVLFETFEGRVILVDPRVVGAVEALDDGTTRLLVQGFPVRVKHPVEEVRRRLGLDHETKEDAT